MPMEFLGIPLFDDDLWKMLLRFAIDVVVVSVLVIFCYRKHGGRSSYVFSFLLLNVMVFFICFTLKKLDLGLGMALGLFAVFGIIRYRTDTIRVKEMTYMFVIVGIAVINALANRKSSYIELVATNAVILLTAFILEARLKRPPVAKRRMTYDDLALLAPGRESELLQDIADRTGIPGERVTVSSMDLKNGVAQIVLHFDPAQMQGGA